MLNKVKSLPSRTSASSVESQAGAYGGKKAFTLIELLIVIAIIGILATLIIIALNAARNKAKDAQIKSDANSLSKAMEIVRIDRDLSVVGWVGSSCLVDNTSTTNDSNIARWLDNGLDANGNPTGKRLVSAIPTHPKSGQCYQIKIASNGYALLAMLIDSSGQNWWCVNNGNAREIDGKNLNNARKDCATGL